MKKERIEKAIQLDGKVAVITGTARQKGIGFACAKALAMQGANVVISDLGEYEENLTDEIYGLGSVAQLQKAVQELEGCGAKAIYVPADMTKQGDRERLIKTAVETFGRVDILVNVAAAMFNTTVLNSDRNAWDVSYEVNVKGVIELTRCAIPYMKQQGGGTVVNISSGVGVGALPGMAPYVCTKHANVALTKYFAAEYGKYNIRFNVICPGNTWTENWDEEMAMINRETGKSIEQILEETRRAAWLNKIGTPMEIGAVAAFLCSPGAGFINGATVMVDGGSCEGNLH